MIESSRIGSQMFLGSDDLLDSSEGIIEWVMNGIIPLVEIAITFVSSAKIKSGEYFSAVNSDQINEKM